jgi:hypothetical protein
MGQLGELFPGRKLRSEADSDKNGELVAPGPLDLDRGVAYLSRAHPTPEQEPRDQEPPVDQDS